MIRSTIITFGARVLSLIIAAINAIILARVLGPEGKGVLSVLATTGALLSLIGNLGLGVSNVYFVGQGKYSINVLFTNSIVGGFGLGVLVVGVAHAVLWYTPSLFRGIGPGLFALFSVSIPFSLAAGYLANLILGLQRVTAFNALNLLPNLFLLMGYISLLRMAPNIITAVALSAVASIIGFICWIAYLVSIEGWRAIKPNFKLTAIFDSIGFGFKGQAGNILQFLNYRLDALIVNAFSGPGAVGLYSTAVTLAEVTWQVSGAIATVLFPKISSSNDAAENIKLASLSSRLSIMVAIIEVVILAFATPWLIRTLFGDNFAGAIPALEFLLPGILVFSITNVLASFIAGSGKPEYNTIVAGIAAIVTLSLDFVLIPRWGIIGAAVASTLSYIVSTIITIRFYVSMTQEKIRNICLPKVSDIKLIYAKRTALFRSFN